MSKLETLTPSEAAAAVEEDEHHLGQAKWNELVARAVKVLYDAQREQTDRLGWTYVMHPMRVAARIHPANPAGQIVALLHDVVEDGAKSEQPTFTLENLGTVFPQRIIKALDAISRRDGESYADYLDRVNEDSLARLVKRADLEDNLDPRRRRWERVELVDEKTGDVIHSYTTYRDASLRKRYERALRALAPGDNGQPLGWRAAAEGPTALRAVAARQGQPRERVKRRHPERIRRRIIEEFA